MTAQRRCCKTPGNPATLSLKVGLRPEALRPALSGGLPFSSKNPQIIVLVSKKGAERF